MATPPGQASKKSASGSGVKRPTLHSQQSKVQTLFDHLPHSLDSKAVLDGEHPDVDHIFFTLGLKYSSGKILGSNQRCLALLDALQAYIKAFVTPEGKEFRHNFSEQLQPNLTFLKKCRPFAVAMENAVEFFNTKRNVPANDCLSEEKLKVLWIEALSDFQEGIKKAKEAIVEKAMDKIQPSGDTVLIYGFSEVVQEVILAAASPSKKFDLVIVADRPLGDQKLGKGLGIINALMNRKEYTKNGCSQNKPDFEESILSITYTSMTGLSNVIRRVTKVFLGAHALLTNGGVLAHTGTSQVALMAAAHNIPVLVCCETYKFCDKSPTDSFFHNEFGNGFGIIQSLPPLVNTAAEAGQETLDDTEVMEGLQRDGMLLTPVIKYDVTPPELVTAVITDVDILPCTSVPVVLRVHENRQLLNPTRRKEPYRRVFNEEPTDDFEQGVNKRPLLELPHMEPLPPSNQQSGQVLPVENSVENITENSAMEVLENCVENLTENPAMDVLENGVENLTENPAMDVLENGLENLTENPAMEVLENGMENLTENPAMEVLENGVENLTENPAMEVLENCVENLTENLVNMVENPVENLAENLVNVVANPVEKLVENYFGNLAMEVLENGVENLTENLANMVENPVENIAENLVNVVANPVGELVENYFGDLVEDSIENLADHLENIVENYVIRNSIDEDEPIEDFIEITGEYTFQELVEKHFPNSGESHGDTATPNTEQSLVEYTGNLVGNSIARNVIEELAENPLEIPDGYEGQDLFERFFSNAVENLVETTIPYPDENLPEYMVNMVDNFLARNVIEEPVDDLLEIPDEYIPQDLLERFFHNAAGKAVDTTIPNLQLCTASPIEQLVEGVRNGAEISLDEFEPELCSNPLTSLCPGENHVSSPLVINPGDPVGNPTENVTGNPIQSPVGNSIQNPVFNPIQNPVAIDADEPFQTAFDADKDKPVENSIENSVNAVSVTSAEKASGRDGNNGLDSHGLPLYTISWCSFSD